MARDWKELTDLTGGQKLLLEKVLLVEKDVRIEGAFELPPLAQLTSGDQIFVIAFIKTHGSIKEMERLFGVSYPTIKARLTQVASQLDFVEVNPPASRGDILNQLERGEISASEAVDRIKK